MYKRQLEGFRIIVIVEITREDVLSVLCPVSVLSHSLESCGTCLTRTGVVFHNINDNVIYKDVLRHQNSPPMVVQYSGHMSEYDLFKSITPFIFPLQTL